MYTGGVLTDNKAERAVGSVGGAEPDDASPVAGTHCCLVAIGRLQVTSCPNTSDLMSASSSTEFISRHSIDGKFTFVDHRFVSIWPLLFHFQGCWPLALECPVFSVTLLALLTLKSVLASDGYI